MITWPTPLRYSDSEPSIPLTPLKYPESMSKYTEATAEVYLLFSECIFNSSTPRPCQVHHRLRSNVDLEGGKYISAVARCTCLPSRQHRVEVALRGKQVHLGYASVYLLSSSCNFNSSPPRPSPSPQVQLGFASLDLGTWTWTRGTWAESAKSTSPRCRTYTIIAISKSPGLARCGWIRQTLFLLTRTSRPTGTSR